MLIRYMFFLSLIAALFSPSAKAADDPGNTAHYAQANKKLAPPTDHRVVYFGDSITELWGAGIPGLMSDDVLNRGISGQTTDQMLARFDADVINLQPKIVHILAGTNDIAGNGGPVNLDRVKSNLQTMVERAQRNGISVVLASILPVKSYFWNPSVDAVPLIRNLNDWIVGFARGHQLSYVDYFSAFDDGSGGFITKYSNDGVHPNQAGYAVMVPLARQAILNAAKH